jgi:hypothetical protein
MKKQCTNLARLLLAALIATACSEYSSSEGDSGYNSSDGSSSGQGGSMARFTLSGDYLYTVENDRMKVFDLSDPARPYHLPSKDKTLEAGAETLFTIDTLLFVGSRNGMYIYNITDRERPAFLSLTLHVTSCDPVVSDGKYAYVTLNSNDTWCGRSSNLLQVYDIADTRDPRLVAQEQLDNPRGLGLSGTKLFVCDKGVKVFDVSNPERPKWVDDLDHIREIAGIEAYDVIPLATTLLVIGEDGFYQVDHSGDRLSLVSKIVVKKE